MKESVVALLDSKTNRRVVELVESLATPTLLGVVAQVVAGLLMARPEVRLVQ